MTQAHLRTLYGGLAAGTLIGLALGGMIALLILIRPELFAALFQ